MEQCRQSPVFQEQIGCPAVLRPHPFSCFYMVEFLKGAPVSVVRLINCQPQCKHVYRVGIVIPVFHQQRAAVCFIFGEKLHHILGSPVFPEKDLQIAVINRIGIFCHAGIDKPFQRFFQAHSVDIHLHIVGDLVSSEAFPLIYSCFFLLCCLFCIEMQFLTTVVDKTGNCRLQIISITPICIKWRLHRAKIFSVSFPVDFSHLFQCCVSHNAPPVLC